LKQLAYTLILAAVFFTTGCANKIYLSLGLEQDSSLKYKLISDRQVTLNITGGEKLEKPQSCTEKLEMVVRLTPVDIDEFGLVTMQAECETMNVSRKSFTGRVETKDPLNVLAGKSWQYKINPAGEIEDFRGLEQAAKIAGTAAIKESGVRRIKDPDMILDFIALQWSLWDAVSSANKTGIGVTPGQSWDSLQMVPFSVAIPAERIVHYSIDSNKQPADGSYVVIDSEYDLSTYILDPKDGKLKFVPAFENRPKPYDGSFQTRGMFGFLRNYKPLELSGTGTTKYDSRNGVLLSETQQYQMKMEAGFMMALGDSVPMLDVRQTISAELINE
jgi:hypothetical protein